VAEQIIECALAGGYNCHLDKQKAVFYWRPLFACTDQADD
jgi:Zn-finger protein